MLDTLLLQYPVVYFLLEITLKTSLVICVAWGVNYFCREQPASNSSLVWLVAVIAALSIPVISLLVPGITVELEFTATQLDKIDPSVLSATVASSQNQVEFLDKILVSATNLYLIVVMLMMCYLGAGLLRLFLLANTTKKVESETINEMFNQLKLVNGVSTSILLLSSPSISTPLTWGIFRHRILLPEAALSWDKVLLQQALSHELGHIQRNDWFYQLLAKIVLCLHWPNPLAWFAANALKIESEKACDDAAIDSIGSNVNYAKNLLGVASNISNRSPYVAIGLFSRPSVLAQRINHILSHNKNRAFLRSDEIFIALISALIVVAPFSLLHFSTKFIESTEHIEQSPPVIAKNEGLERSENVAAVEPNEIIEESSGAKKPVAITRVDSYSPSHIGIIPKRKMNLVFTEEIAKTQAVSYDFEFEKESLYGNWESTPLHTPNPKYPERAINRKIEGYIVAEYKIADDGKVFDVTIIESVPTGTFERSVLTAVNDFIYCSEIAKGIGGNSKPVRKRFSFSLRNI
jgi:TonB family protein